MTERSVICESRHIAGRVALEEWILYSRDLDLGTWGSSGSDFWVRLDNSRAPPDPGT